MSIKLPYRISLSLNMKTEVGASLQGSQVKPLSFSPSDQTSAITQKNLLRIASVQRVSTPPFRCLEHGGKANTVRLVSEAIIQSGRPKRPYG